MGCPSHLFNETLDINFAEEADNFTRKVDMSKHPLIIAVAVEYTEAIVVSFLRAPGKIIPLPIPTLIFKEYPA